MFHNDHIEKGKEVIALPLVRASTFSTILTYMYTGKIDINCENAQYLFEAASMFVMEELKLRCGEFLAKELHVSNCIGMYSFTTFHHCPELEQAAGRFCIQHFKDVIHDETLMRLESMDLAKLLQSDELNVDDEKKVAYIIVNWIAHNHPKEPSAELLLCLRLPLLQKDFIKRVLCSNQILMGSDEFCTMLADHELRNEEPSDDLKRLGMFARKMFVFVSGGMNDAGRSMGCYDPETKKNYWALPMHSSFDFKFKIDYHRIVVNARNDIFLSGGVMYNDYISNNETPALDTLHKFNAHDIQWEALPKMLSPRCAHGFVSIARMLYVIGGKRKFPKGKPLDSVHAFDIDMETWEVLSPMPVKLYHHAAVAHEKKIFVLGGLTTDEISESDGNRNVLVARNEDEEMVTKVCMEYIVETDTWTRLESKTNMPRSQFGATICNHLLYVIGGCNGQHKLSTVEIYDFKLKKWRYGTDFPEDRKAIRAVTLDGCVYVCGGVRSIISRQDQTPRVVEARDLWKYDPETRQWNQEVRLMQYANIHACAVANMNTKKVNPSEFVSSLHRRRQAPPQND